MNFGAIIIGDEILSGKRTDRHFDKIVSLLAARGLRLSWAEYLGDARSRIAITLKRTFASGDVVFSFGGIGNTPDDHTRQAAAEALGVDLVLHPDAEREIRARFGDDVNPVRLLLGTFPRGVDIVPNPFNRIAGFRVRDHYFLPGFPQMAHPMAEWALDTFYAHLFNRHPMVDKAFLLTGPNAYESALLDLMERIVADYPDLRLFSLPSIGEDRQRRHLELGVEGVEARVDQALEEIRLEVERRGIAWRWRD
jgi:molybdopterin-biosynthesis enzyme MoeA-like protein